MIQGILFSGVNIDRVLNFCGDKASFHSELHVDSIKEKQQCVFPGDFILKSSRGNIRIISREQFLANFKKKDPSFELWQLTHPFFLSDKK